MMRILTKHILLLFWLVFLLASCSEEQGNQDALSSKLIFESAKNDESGHSGPVFEFETMLHDFGTVIKGEQVQHTFRFSNSGNRPLVISNVSGSCGCTVTDYSKEPVQPGREGFIEVLYDSKKRNPGRFNQTVSVVANTNPNNHTLRVTGEVKPQKPQ